MKTVIFSLVLALSLLATVPLHASSVFYSVTPTKAKAAGFTFNITHEQLPDGSLRFRVVVTEGKVKFGSNTSTALGAVKITDHSESIDSTRSIVSEHEGRSIACTFTVDKSALNDPNFCFVFTNYAEEVINGKLVQMPSADFVYAHLKDFAR